MKIATLVTCLVITFFSFAQKETDQQLAQHYFASGDFEKASMYYEKIVATDPSKFNFNRYYECLLQLKDFKQAEKILKKQININRLDLDYKVLLGKLYEESNQEEKAKKLYEELIDDLTADPGYIINLFTAFRNQNKNELAYKVIDSGRKLLKNSYPLHFQFAEYYGAIGQTEKMLDEYIGLLDFQSSYAESIQNLLIRQYDFSQPDLKEFDYLKSSLLSRIQKNPSEQVYVNMLVWLFIQRKNFDGALLQLQALDKRLEEQGRRVFELGTICIENAAYESARKSFRYVIGIGQSSPYYLKAENALLNTRFLEVTTNRNYSKEEITATIADYKTVLQRVGKRPTSLPLIMELSHIQAFYANQADSAILNLTAVLKTPGLTDMQRAEAKLLLGDIHVLHGDIWEASLLYMQIQNDLKFEPIGQEAKYKNARIFYYDAEFDYAQEQLNILKESTSKLIANDAMQLSIMITDNYGIDSNYQAMSWFAKADLFIEQHNYEAAFVLFDSIIKAFPYHSLSDEIYFKKAQAMQQQGKWNEAIDLLTTLLKYHKDDILADDALFQLAEITELQLKDLPKATEIYKTLLFDYKGSLFAEEARKRLRLIRGDQINVTE
jgi:tetratricopeptide (TPR) repeat protein